MAFKDYQNIHRMLDETVERLPDQTAYRWFMTPDQLISVTWKEFDQRVTEVSKALLALGVEKGDKVNILSYTSYRWVLTDLGVTRVGGATVGIYQSTLGPDCRYIIDHSEAVVVFAENETQLEKLMQIREQIPRVRKVVMLQGEAPVGDQWVIDYEGFLSLGKDIADAEVAARAEAVTPSDPAGIIYTSGTTGVPKGVVLTHSNITFTAQSVQASSAIQDGDETFLFLPLAHVFARTAIYTAIRTGTATTFARSIDTLIADFKVARPHWFISVPRIFEKIHGKVIDGAEAKGGIALKIFRWACGAGAIVSAMKQARAPIPLVPMLKYRVAEKLVFNKIRAALGGRVRWCISGAAPLNPDIARFFHAAGLLVLEGLGMTENTSFSNVNRPTNYRFGWVGPPGVGIEHKLDEDGEVLYKGGNVMVGYYKMPKETEETFTADGWLRTGDIGEIDHENFLRITGRKKELIITAGGKNVAPAPIEGVMATSKYIQQVCVIGDKRKFLSAIVTLDPDNIAIWARERGIPFNSVDDLVDEPRVQSLIEAEVAEKNKSFASYESVKKVTIVPEFTIENGMMTPTMKLKKPVIFNRYGERIDGMYGG